MAETPLPSRADAIEMMAWHSQRLDSDEVWALIAARASGRLVDREAIDYEAAAAAYSEARQNGNAPRYPATEADRMWSRKIVEAAIGDTE